MPRSPADITFLTIVAAFSATEYAEATTRMRRAGEAMLKSEKKHKPNLNISLFKGRKKIRAFYLTFQTDAV